MKIISFFTSLFIAVSFTSPAIAELSSQAEQIISNRACNYLQRNYTLRETLDQIAYTIRRNDPKLRRQAPNYSSSLMGRYYNSLTRLNNTVDELSAEMKADEIIAKAVIFRCPNYIEYIQYLSSTNASEEQLLEVNQRFQEKYPNLNNEPQTLHERQKWFQIFFQVKEQYK